MQPAPGGNPKSAREQCAPNYYAQLSSGASEYLQGLGDAAVAALIEALGDWDPRVSAAASKCLEEMGEAAIPWVIQSLADPDAGVSAAASKYLRQSGDAAVPALIEALGESDAQVSSGASKYLQGLGDAAVAALIEALGESDARVSSAALKWLEEMGERAAPALVEVLADSDPRVSDAVSPLLDRIMPGALTNSVGMRFVRILPGEFTMGSPDSDEDASTSETPQHRVKITKPFYLGATEVTQEQYERVMGENPSHFTGDAQCPVEKVSWEDAVELCRRLSEKEGETYRLPTEAEWEYACRAGGTTKWCFGDSESQLGDYAWYSKNSPRTTHPVGQKRPNAWGLYDMHGNVFEWCADWDADYYYSASPATDPKGPDSGVSRVLRGGSWGVDPRYTRSADRCGFGLTPDYRDPSLGFRLARTP